MRPALASAPANPPSGTAAPTGQQRRLGPFRPWERFFVHYPLDGGREHMATSAERMRALRDRARRGLRRFTITVNADDLRVIAEHG
jgi:hypothetical protein